MDQTNDDGRAPFAESLSAGEPEGDRAPSCPVCNRRLAILGSRMVRNDEGVLVRRQLWGCPRGHATAYRTDGVFGDVEVLPPFE